MKPYCTQNNGDCSTCSLNNYNRDCQNNVIATKTTNVNIRIEPAIKTIAEANAKQLGLTLTSYITMLIMQAKLKEGKNNVNDI